MCTDIDRYQDKIQDFQDRQMKEYLAQTPERDKKAEAVRAISTLIDAHPIGRPVPHGGCSDPR